MRPCTPLPFGHPGARIAPKTSDEFWRKSRSLIEGSQTIRDHQRRLRIHAVDGCSTWCKTCPDFYSMGGGCCGVRTDRMTNPGAEPPLCYRRPRTWWQVCRNYADNGQCVGVKGCGGSLRPPPHCFDPVVNKNGQFSAETGEAVNDG